MLDEILTRINNSDDVVKSIKESFNISYFKNYMELLVSDKWTTVDVNTVDYTSYGYHRSMAGALLLNRQSWNIVLTVLMNPLASNVIKEKQFKALMEMLYENEASILLAILTKNLESLYPNITFSKVVEAIN
jgi:hypothetical protein